MQKSIRSLDITTAIENRDIKQWDLTSASS